MTAVWARRVRRAGRSAVALAGLAFAVMVGMQFEGIVVKNATLAGRVRASQERIDALIAREVQQRRTIARLEAPGGAVPEIHDELREVAPNEELIEVRGAAVRAPDWETQQ